ncbi:MAG: efflux RND transporter permease subunit, partial [Leptospiraceae bacterium]|nr:efflux RND transporter permease subunit [Leptospiraceae bacterium]
MIAKIIDYSLRNRALVLIVSVMVMGAGIYSALNIPIDAIPDLSDVQVIVYTEYPGQAPEVIEDQITYPLSSAMLAVPHARVVRGYSFFGFSLVYVIFEDGTDLYDARSRVLEYLNFATGRLPSGVRPQIGPDATGVGWVYMYVLSDPTGRNNLQELRSIQDWVLKYELASLDGVSEVASLGGFVKQYQVIVDPTRLINHEISLAHLRSQLARSNSDTGGRLIEMGETEYMVRGLGYIESTRDIEDVVLKVDGEGNPITIGDVAIVQIGPEIRRGIADWNGEGEVVTGIVVMRQGENTLEVIERVKQRLREIRPSLPEGVEIRDGYDRSQLINRAVANVTWKLLEEMIVVAIVVAIFLRHARSALVAIVTLPVGVLASLLLMYVLEINANVMSLGGIAIAIGVMVDASIVLTENLHKHMEKVGSDAIVPQSGD